MARREPLTTSVTLRDATREQRLAVQRLLGRPQRDGTALTVSLVSVDEVVRRSGACPDGLAVAVVALHGPVTDRVAEADELEAAWRRVFEPVEAVIGADLAGWLAGIRATGLVRRLAPDPATAAGLLADLAKVLTALPGSGEPIGQFAARVLRGAHDLDDDRPLTTLVLGAARSLRAFPDGSGAEWRREVWASVGLLRDELSSTALCVGLPGDPDTGTGRMLGALGESGQPAVLTLRQLVTDPPRLRLRGRVVSVCENPAVVAAAASRLGARCAPLICTRGQPGAAVMVLLRAVAAAGAELRYHGDFDWGGLRIGNTIFGRTAARPWRFGAADYRDAAASWSGRTLTGPPTAAAWDAELTSAMAATGTAVDEEHVIDDLVDDLSEA
ncbi:MAG: TIGR02679 family protein [Actinophytocola sp.]|nr:TIGR02679 family protein [Actinophytocola sp.]